jgi:hypothetical protein
MELNIDLTILETESAAEYHAKAERFLSSHQLLDFMKCPWLHHKKRAGQLVENESPSYLLGRAAHVRILEGRAAYEAAYRREIANAGFFALRSNPATIALLEQEVVAVRSGVLDQDFLNDLICHEKMPCRYGFLPSTFFNDYLAGPTAPACDQMILYHSANTPVRDGKTSVQIKMERHLAMRARVLGLSVP